MTESYSIDRVRMQVLCERAEDLTRWIAKNAPECLTSQKHLDEGTVEQAYWHYGYACAIRDVLAIINRAGLET